MRSIETTVFDGEPLRLALLGRVDVRVAGHELVLRYAKLQALLARLAMSAGQPLRRDYLADLLWPDMPRPTNLQNLRRAIFNLKAALGEAGPLIATNRDEITLEPQGVWLDVAQFSAVQSHCAVADASCQTCLLHMDSRAALYAGEFMTGFALADCPGFEEWLGGQREILLGRALALMQGLATSHEQAGTFSLALPFALRQAELQPWNEAHCRQVMRLYARSGQGSAASHHFNTYCQHLKAELDVLPREETRLLAQSIEAAELAREGEQNLKTPTLSKRLQIPAERRQVTVLYCELSLYQIADPEEALKLLAPAQSCCAAIIAQHGGHIVQTFGGGMLAYFGYPNAHENAARRAVQAALAITHEAAPGVDLRTGAHTGLIITSPGSNQPDNGGRTTKIAIHIRQLAGSRQTIISGETHRLVGGYFDCISLGQAPLHGMARAPEVFNVLKESGALTRLDAAGRLTPLVGRTAELAQLMGLWQEAVSGTRHTVLIQGDAGIGKSRLVHAMKANLVGTPHAVREARCFAEFSQTPFQPLIMMLRTLLGFEEGEAPRLKSIKLRQYLQTHHQKSAAQAVPLLTELLALPLEGPATPLSPDARKAQTIAVLLDILQELASKQPTLLVVEDAHWIDPSTLGLLTEFMNTPGGNSILAVLTARADFCAPWHSSLATRLCLAPLTNPEIETLLGLLRPDIAPATRRSVVERADGVPLFAEEMANMSNLDQVGGIPDTLQDLLATRLDQTGEAKYTAQLASNIGRGFNLNVLAKIFPYGADALARTLRTLEMAGLVVRDHQADQKFKHALIQQAAYQSQTKADRQAAHEKIAQVLQSDFPELVAAQPELLARHLSEGGCTGPAIIYWLKAGQRAIDRSAYLEAIEDFKSGLVLLPHLPADESRDRLAIELHIGLGSAFIAVKGYGSADAEHTFNQAIALAEPLGDHQRLFQAVWGMWLSSSAHIGNFRAITVAQKLLALAERGAEPVQLQQALYAMGHSLLWAGHIVQVRCHLERAVSLYQAPHHSAMASRYMKNTCVANYALLACALWLQGYPDQAVKASEQAVALARQLDHPHSLVFALCFAAIVRRLMRQYDTTGELAQEAVAVSKVHGLTFWQALGSAHQGWVLAMRGQSEGAVQIQRCQNAVIGNMGGVKIMFLTPLSEALVHLGEFENALTPVLEALQLVHANNDRYFESEYHRLQGLCLLGASASNPSQAEHCFHQALAVSRKQGSKSLELRAATSMARLWLAQGKVGQARRLLQDIQSWFTEGITTPDFQESADLLSTIAAGRP